MKKTLLIATAMTTWALSQSAAQNTSPVLQSLPAEARQHIEDLQKACRELNEESNLPEGDYALGFAPRMTEVMAGFARTLAGGCSAR